MSHTKQTDTTSQDHQGRTHQRPSLVGLVIISALYIGYLLLKD